MQIHLQLMDLELLLIKEIILFRIEIILLLLVLLQLLVVIQQSQILKTNLLLSNTKLTIYVENAKKISLTVLQMNVNVCVFVYLVETNLDLDHV